MNMDNLRRAIREHPIWSALIAQFFVVAIIDHIIAKITYLFFDIFAPGVEVASNLQVVIYTLISFVVLCIIFSRVYSLQLFGVRLKGLWKGLLFGLIGFSFSVIPRIAMGGFGWSEMAMNMLPFSASMLCAILAFFAAAFGEEIKCRGYGLNILMQGFGYNRAGVYRALLISGLIFALAHTPHLIMVSEMPLLPLLLFLLLQIVDKVSFAVFAGAIYLRCNNLFAVGLLHGLYNLLMLLPTILSESDYALFAQVNSASFTMDFSDLLVLARNELFSVVLLLFGLFLARKIKPIEQAESEV